MIIIPDAFSDENIKAIRQYAERNPELWYVNWQVGDEVIDQRLTISDQAPEFQPIKHLVDRYFSDYISVWSAYQHQTRPHSVHIDEYGSDRWPEINSWTFVISMDTIPEFRAIIWQERFCDGQEFNQWLASWLENRDQMINHKISLREDLEHTYDENNQDYPVDYLTPEGVFSYVKGSAVLFDAHKLHCTSNWRKYPQFTRRELLQIHVLSNNPRQCI